MITGLLHPGAMGASVGYAATNNAQDVLWLPDGRSAASQQRAERAGLTPSDNLTALCDQSDIILAVCPPHGAAALADAVIKAGFKGTYVEANAISPDQSRAIADKLGAAGITAVDGGIIGGPAWKRESGTCLWLSGTAAQTIVDLFAGSSLHTGVVDDRVGSASALKMCYAAYTKGSTALLAAIMATAEAEGVRDALAFQWGDSFTRETEQRVVMSSAKAWRWVAEMEEIAATMVGAGIPDGFHQAASQVFARLESYKDHTTDPDTPTPEIGAILDSLRQRD